MRLKSTGCYALIAAALAVSAVMAVAPAMAQTAASCSALKGCEQKFCEIETQLSLARQSGDINQVTGLQMALDNARTSCDDSRLKEALNAKLAEANQKLVRYQVDLQQAELDGQRDKVLKYRQKLEEVTSDIHRLKQQLSQLEQLPQ